MSTRIVGAGLAGLLAAHAWPAARVYEVEPAPRAAHRALLRFRSDAVARLTGIEFTPVTVRKGLWARGTFVAPSIVLANQYSLKVLGAIEPRSIWNLDPVQRWVAPETLYEQLVEAVGARITWGTAFDFRAPLARPVVNTAPLPAVLEALDIAPALRPQLHRAPIYVARFRVSSCAVNQTVYFPDVGMHVYRASLTGDLLIVEAMGPEFEAELPQVLAAFGLLGHYGINVERIDTVDQRYGKILELPTAARRALLHQLTREHGIYSLGRFATWRNVLLDDVVQDIDVLRRLMKASAYDRTRFAAGNK